MGVIGAREQKFHRILQRHIRMEDYEFIADKFGLSPRSVQGIAQGRRNNVAVLTALVQQAKENIFIEGSQIDRYLENVTEYNDAHFKGRRMMGLPEEEDDESNSHDSHEKVQ